MISRFFIDRPIFATALSAMITLTGAIAYIFLPLAQYPRITPPAVMISISYPGASAQEVADTVGAPIEQQMNGVEGMKYMSSQSGNDGTYSLTVTFDVGTDLKTALVKVQNKVALAMPLLPTPVQNQGITVRKKTPDLMLIINFFSSDGRYDDLYLSNFATINVKDELLRVPGVADINFYGLRDYSMRAWLDPQKLAARNMTAVDVANAVRSQNTDAPAGRIGQPPIAPGQSQQLPLNTLGRLKDVEQFGDIIVKVGGRPTYLSPNGVVLEANAVMRPAGRPVEGRPPAGAASSLSAATAGAVNGSASISSGSTLMAAPSPSASAPAGVVGPAANSEATGAEPAGGAVGALGLGGGNLSSDMPSPAAAIVRLKDVARIQLGAQNYNTMCTFDGRSSVGLGVYQLPGTNVLEVGERVRAKMKTLARNFPDGVEYKIAYDTTAFVEESVKDVKITLLEAIGLVAVVVVVFLQSWRAALIPLVAVPVAVVGTFAIMAALGYSLNNISLFGLVLAIGIVVDDAIVVVENVERWLEKGYPAKEATRRAMDEVTGPIIAVALVLSAVFVPCAFITGMTGQFYRQFAVTIAVSTFLSAVNSLSLSPALAAILLKGKHEEVLGRQRHGHSPRAVSAAARVFFALFYPFTLFARAFNWAFGVGTQAYSWTVGRMMRRSTLVILGYAGLLVLTGVVFRSAPTGFIPKQDQGRLIVNIQLPDAASMERTHAVLLEVDRIARETPGVAHTVGNTGMSYLLQANSPNFASMFIVLKPFSERQDTRLRDTAIMAHLRKEWAKSIPDALVTVFGASPIPGIGVAGGFKFIVEDRGGMGVKALAARMDDLIQKLKALPTLNSASTQFRPRNPQLFLAIDRSKVASLGVSLDDVNQTLDMFLGSLYVNSYNQFGRHWQVTVQVDSQFRSRPENINLFQVRNKAGQMVPLGEVAKMREIGGPISVTRYNLYTASAINGNVQPGESDGTAIEQINALARKTLPLSMSIEWTDLMFWQIQAGNTALYVFALSVICVFLALAALYESWALPMAVILVVPLCLLCSVGGVLLSHRDVNIFVQIGLVVLVGLACKNAILIVEFARQLHLEGRSRFDATREASHLRLRPILMTSFAFIFGVVPLVLASGAGAEMRRSLGTAVFSGMLGVTTFGIFLTPVFFYIIQGLSEIPFFKNPEVRALGAYLLGGLLGLVAGFSLARLGVGALPWGAVAGALFGMGAVWAIRGMQEANRPENGGNGFSLRRLWGRKALEWGRRQLQRPRS